MFRAPGQTNVTSIETCDGIDDRGSNYWGNLKFTNPFIIKTFHQKVWNIQSQHIGYLLGPWHEKSLIELVPEATFKYFEPTEKTVKPIRAGMPFVIVGCQKFLYRLKKMGFKTFHPIIDESYDLIDNKLERVKSAFNSFLNLSKQDPLIIRKQLQEVLDHNKKCMLDKLWLSRNARTILDPLTTPV